MQKAAMKNATSDVKTSSACHLNAILSSPHWLAALNRWYYASGRHCGTSSSFFGVAPDSWRALQTHLLGTGWFEMRGDHINPSREGEGFLVRINELCRSIGRE